MDHHEAHSGSSNFIQDLVIGLSDGLTVPFALAAGISGAVHSNGLVITAGLAEIAAGSIAMGLGGFLAGQTAVEHYNAELEREYKEVEAVPEIEKKRWGISLLPMESRNPPRLFSLMSFLLIKING